MADQRPANWIRRFDEISIADVPLVGGKNASLGEMFRELASRGVRVPDGFAITAEAYWYFLTKIGADKKIRQLLDRLVNHAGEVAITRSRLQGQVGQIRGSLTDLTENLDRLRQQLRDIELQAESQMQSRLAQAKDSDAGFDPLEFDRFTRVQELTRMMAESVNDVATVQRTLQRSLETTEDQLAAQARRTSPPRRKLKMSKKPKPPPVPPELLNRLIREKPANIGTALRDWVATTPAAKN